MSKETKVISAADLEAEGTQYGSASRQAPERFTKGEKQALLDAAGYYADAGLTDEWTKKEVADLDNALDKLTEDLA